MTKEEYINSVAFGFDPNPGKCYMTIDSYNSILGFLDWIDKECPPAVRTNTNIPGGNSSARALLAHIYYMMNHHPEELDIPEFYSPPACTVTHNDDVFTEDAIIDNLYEYAMLHLNSSIDASVDGDVELESTYARNCQFTFVCLSTMEDIETLYNLDDVMVLDLEEHIDSASKLQHSYNINDVNPDAKEGTYLQFANCKLEKIGLDFQFDSSTGANLETNDLLESQFSLMQHRGYVLGSSNWSSFYDDASIMNYGNYCYRVYMLGNELSFKERMATSNGADLLSMSGQAVTYNNPDERYYQVSLVFSKHLMDQYRPMNVNPLSAAYYYRRSTPLGVKQMIRTPFITLREFIETINLVKSNKITQETFPIFFKNYFEKFSKKYSWKNF